MIYPLCDEAKIATLTILSKGRNFTNKKENPVKIITNGQGMSQAGEVKNLSMTFNNKEK